MERLIIDMDNVMADVTAQFVKWYEKRTGYRIPEHELTGRGETEAFPNPQLARSFLYEPGFFRTVPVMDGAVETIRQLNDEYELYIVSAAMEFPQSLIEKYGWLQQHFPFITWQQIAFCGSKTVIRGDYMIDDHLKNLDFFEGEKLLFTAPHNQLITGYNRVNNWEEVGVALLS